MLMLIRTHTHHSIFWNMDFICLWMDDMFITHEWWMNDAGLCGESGQEQFRTGWIGPSGVCQKASCAAKSMLLYSRGIVVMEELVLSTEWWWWSNPQFEWYLHPYPPTHHHHPKTRSKNDTRIRWSHDILLDVLGSIHRITTRRRRYGSKVTIASTVHDFVRPLSNGHPPLLCLEINHNGSMFDTRTSGRIEKWR